MAPLVQEYQPAAVDDLLLEAPNAGRHGPAMQENDGPPAPGFIVVQGN
jgi:hypothetical protein